VGDARRVGRAAGLVGLVAALLVVVAAAGQARGGSSAGTVHPAALRVVGDVLVVLLVLVVLAGLAIWVLDLVSPRRRRGDPEDEEADEMSPPAAWWEKLPLAIPLALVALMIVVVARNAHPGSPELGPAVPADSARPPGNGGPGSSSPVGSLDWPVIGAVVVLVVVGVVVALLVEGRRDRFAVPREPLPPSSGLAALQAVGLDELRTEPDPRRAVIRAYAAMGALLGLSGLPRRPSETPFEFLARALVGLGASGVAARRLTELFERAEFSDHPITAGFKDEAIDAVSALQAEVAR
jgi:Domain of unknown function (DUF4129)